MTSAAGQRSGLAWRRTALAAAALGAVALRAGVSRGSTLDIVVGAFALLSAVALLAGGHARDATGSPRPAAALGTVATCCLLANLAATVAVLWAA